jgi:flagellar biosynthesis/type III secretory pathway M-ring protein FliF/YscJ
MKLKRTWILRITGGIGVFIIVYSLIRHFTGFTINDYFGESAEKTMFDTIVFIALGFFLYNRKLASDERKEREAKEKAAAEAAASAETEASEETEGSAEAAEEQSGEGAGENPDPGTGEQDKPLSAP